MNKCIFQNWLQNKLELDDSSVQSGDGLEGGGSSGVSLGDAVSRRSISIGGGGDWDSVVSKSSVSIDTSISRPLAKTLGRSGHEGGGSTGVSSNSQTISVSVWSIGVWSVSISVESISLGLGISGSLSVVSVSVWVSISISAVSITIAIWSVSIVSVESISISLGLSISGSLAIDIGSASEACGLRVWGAHAWPVGIGIVESWGYKHTSISLSLGRDTDCDSSGDLMTRRIRIS